MNLLKIVFDDELRPCGLQLHKLYIIFNHQSIVVFKTALLLFVIPVTAQYQVHQPLLFFYAAYSHPLLYAEISKPTRSEFFLEFFFEFAQ
jgi:hypothetical protein